MRVCPFRGEFERFARGSHSFAQDADLEDDAGSAFPLAGAGERAFQGIGKWASKSKMKSFPRQVWTRLS
jgi:hypothetical protein